MYAQKPRHSEQWCSCLVLETAPTTTKQWERLWRAEGCMSRRVAPRMPELSSAMFCSCHALRRTTSSPPSHCQVQIEVASLSDQKGDMTHCIMQCAAVTRLDWLRNAAGLRQIEYWTGKLQPRPTVDWYGAFRLTSTLPVKVGLIISLNAWCQVHCFSGDTVAGRCPVVLLSPVHFCGVCAGTSTR